MKKIIIISIISCALMNTVPAQTANDAMLFSRYYAGGTARSVGMSGAFGALGGDLSALSTNPAGVAVYRSSEFTFTPGLVFSNTDATHIGNPGAFNDSQTRFIFNNIGYVYTKNLYNEKGLRTINFGISYNRLSDFNSSAFIKTSSANSSMLDEFVYYANGYDIGRPRKTSEFDDFYEGLAWDMYAVDYDKDNDEFFSDYTPQGYGQPLYRSMSTKGGIGEYDFSLGLNFNHKLFFGATLGLQDIYYKEYFFHEENPDFEFMRYFNFSDEYSVSGFGLNFKTGIIYRPIQMLRLGAAVHTPTHIWMKPYHLTGMGVRWNNPPVDDGSEPSYLETESDPSERYRISTPWRYNLSVASVIGNFGMVDVDVEIADYSNCKIFPSSDYDIENEDIADILKTAVNVKGGAEFRLGPVYLRGGVAFYGNPYVKNQFDSDIRNTLKGTMSYSGGIGFRARSFYMDMAYSYMKHPERINDMYLTYDATTEWYEQVKLRTTSNKIVVTFGFRF